MKNFITILLLVFIAISCDKEIDPVITEETKSITVEVSVSDSTDSRVAMDKENSTDVDGWSFVWEEGDALSAWYSGCTKSVKFSMDVFDSNSSTFTGSVDSEVESLRFIYPYENVIIKDDKYTVDISEQDGTLDKCYMISSEAVDISGDENISISGLSMKHIGAFMAVIIDLTNEKEGITYKLTGLEYAGIPTVGTVDMTADFDNCLTTTNTNRTVEVDLGDDPLVFGYDDGYFTTTAYINILPFELGASESVTVNLTIEISEDEDGTVLENLTTAATIANNSSSAVPFARATHNYTYLTVDASYGIEITGAKINDWDEVVDNGDLDITPVND